jgi:hypothetical protein
LDHPRSGLIPSLAALPERRTLRLDDGTKAATKPGFPSIEISCRQGLAPMAQASAIATVQQIAPGRLMVGFGIGFTGRAGMGKKALSLASMRTHITQVQALLRGDVVDIDGGLAQILASDGQLPDRPINVRSTWRAKTRRPEHSRRRLPMA